MRTNLLLLLLLIYASTSCHAHVNPRPHATHRSRRALLDGSNGYHDAHHHPQNPSQVTGITTPVADVRGSSLPSSSTSNSPPNSWLYKFPPWFLPGNPAPDGISFVQGTTAQSFSQGDDHSTVDDGDILIIDEKFDSNNKFRHVDNVRVPGNSAFQNEVVQTVLEVKYGQTQGPPGGGLSGEVVTPWQVPQSVPEPPQQPFPSSTVPIMPQDTFKNDILNDFTSNIQEQDNFRSAGGFVNNVVTLQPHNNQQNLLSFSSQPHNSNGGYVNNVLTSQPHNNQQNLLSFSSQPTNSNGGLVNNVVISQPNNKKHGVVSFFSQPANTSPVIYNKVEGIFLPKIVTESTPRDFPKRTFRPSLPDPSLTARPFNIAQKGHSQVSSFKFRPSQLISVRISADPQHSSNNELRDLSVNSQHPQYNNNNNNIFLREQQAAFLKASDRPQVFRQYSNDNSVRNVLQSSGGKGEVNRVPLIPGVPFPILLHQSLKAAQTGRREAPQHVQSPVQGHRHGGRRDLRQQQGGSPASHRPGSAPASNNLPTSIQDIINSDSDPSQKYYQRTRDYDISFATADGRITSPAAGDDGDKNWLWPTS